MSIVYAGFTIATKVGKGRQSQVLLEAEAESCTDAATQQVTKEHCLSTVLETESQATGLPEPSHIAKAQNV